MPIFNIPLHVTFKRAAQRHPFTTRAPLDRSATFFVISGAWRRLVELCSIIDTLDSTANLTTIATGHPRAACRGRLQSPAWAVPRTSVIDWSSSSNLRSQQSAVHLIRQETCIRWIFANCGPRKTNTLRAFKTRVSNFGCAQPAAGGRLASDARRSTVSPPDGLFRRLVN